MRVFGSSTTFDLEASVALNGGGGALNFGVSVMACNASDAEVLLSINVSAASGVGLRSVVMQAVVPNGPASFNSLLKFEIPDADAIDIRVLGDRELYLLHYD